MKRALRALIPLCLLACFQAMGFATQVVPERVLFPLVAESTFASNGLAYVLEPQLRDELFHAGDRIQMQDVLLPTSTGVDEVDLTLEHMDVLTDDFELWLNGKRSKGAEELRAELSLWSGVVDGEEGSSVYLAFTPTVTLGWIARESGTAHVFGIDDPDAGWAAGRCAIVHESDPAMQVERPGFKCQTLLPPGQAPPSPSSVPQVPLPQVGGSSTGTPEVLVSVETDYQFYQLFGNVQVASDYALTLWGAIDLLYTAEVGTHVRLPYLGIYSNSNDPWTESDTGTAGTLLDEFRVAWTNKIPNGGDLGHFNSGASLGGGVAYVDVLCNDPYGFAVSGDLHGQTPFPVQTTNALNWDFYVTAHELGHNFGTPHTHDFCPVPLDECSPTFGPCQTQTVCQVGTIMSYCHLCPGGMVNIDTTFHPTVAALLISKVAAASCIGSCTTCDQPPLVDFAATPLSGSAPLISTFTSVVYGEANAYQWDFGDGMTSSFPTTGHVYVFPGTYDVSLSVTWSGGVETIVQKGLIVVSGGTNASATIRNGSGTNPSVFVPMGVPFLGANWVSTIDGTSLGASGLSFVFGFGRAATGVPTAFGELLVDPSSNLLLSNIAFLIGGVGTHTEAVPNDTSLIGFPIYTQGFLSGASLLTNGIDLILGN